MRPHIDHTRTQLDHFLYDIELHSVAKLEYALHSAATTLFNNALKVTEIGVVLARYGYDVATLRRERELITAYKQALRAQALAKGAAKQATLAQTQALSEMQQWIAQYTKITKVALRTRPELLKALGITRQTGRPSRDATPEASTPPPAPPQG